jgi:hypothetical protein
MLEVPEAVASNSLAKAVRKGISRLRAVPEIFDVNGGALSDSVLECRAGCDIQEESNDMLNVLENVDSNAEVVLVLVAPKTAILALKDTCVGHEFDEEVWGFCLVCQ